jgi:histidinol-phosphatase (PHP family)
MLLTNYHTHTHFCDGAESPVKYCNMAIQKNISVLGFSSHAPLPFPCKWTLPVDRFDEYVASINRLKEDYRSKVEIYCGLEMDYIPALWNTIKSLYDISRLDYLIGSIHFVDEYPDGTPWTIDGSNEEFRKGFREVFHNDSHAVIRKYFQYTREMIDVMQPKIIGHIDKIKMQHNGDCLVPETDLVYRDELIKTLEKIATSGNIVEINTRGVYRRNETDFYPSFWVIQEMAQLKIPVMVNSDAHQPDELTKLFEAAFAQLKRAGYREVMMLHNGEWASRKIV